MENNNNEVSPSKGKVSRRDFLKLGGAIAASAAVGCALGLKPDKPEAETSPEILLKPSVKVLDYFDMDKNIDEFTSSNFPPDYSVEKAWQEMGVSDTSDRDGILKAVSNDENQARLIIMALFVYQYKSHGSDVVSVMEKTAEYINPEQAPNSPGITSIASAVGFGKVEYDEIGNPTIHAVVNSEIFEKIVSQSSESIINMSCEMGKFSLKYSIYDTVLKYPEMRRQFPSKVSIGDSTTYHDYKGNDISKEEYEAIISKIDEKEAVTLEPHDRNVRFLDGYAGENTLHNLSLLTEMAGRHPEKMFIAAGGNPTFYNGLRLPDIRDARAMLEKQGLWPDNLLIVGFQARESSFVGQASYGADIYVSDKDLEGLGFRGASSYATPVVAEICRQLIARGLNSNSLVKDKLLELTQEEESWEGQKKTTYKLLDLDKAKTLLSQQ